MHLFRHPVSLIASPEKFRILYEKNHLSVFRYIFGLVGGSQDEAEDLTAETFLRAWKARHRFEGDMDSAIGWLIQIAKRLVIDNYRRSLRVTRNLPADPQSIPTPEQITIDDEQRKTLFALLKELPDEQREIIVLRHMLGWRVSAIARHIGMTENNVSVIIHRTLAKLKDKWLEAEPERRLLEFAQKENLMNRTPDEKQIQELLENTLPIPGARLDQRLSAAPWTSRMVARRHFFVTATLAVIIVLAIIVVTPQGHAWAQELLKYFTMVSTKLISTFPTQVSAPTSIVEALLVLQENNSVDNQTCEGKISPISSTFFCQLKDAQNKLRFAIKSFSINSVQAQFEFMSLDQSYGILQMDFKGNDISYSLTQGVGDFPQDCPGCVIYEGAVQAVRVGAYQAEYAKGAFFFKNGPNNDMEWNPDEPVYQLRWKEDEYWYKLVLSTFGSRVDYSDEEIQEEMIYIAENLVGLDQGSDQLTAGDQPSIKDSIGFTLKEPGLLPEDFFQVSYGGWSNLTTAPRVGMQYDHIVNGQWVDGLMFHQMLIPSDDYQTLRREFALIYQEQPIVNGHWGNSSTDEEVQINGRTGYYLDAEEANAYALYWRDEEKEYLLIYFWAPEFGRRLEKQTLIQIAESLR